MKCLILWVFLLVIIMVVEISILFSRLCLLVGLVFFFVFGIFVGCLGFLVFRLGVSVV